MFEIEGEYTTATVMGEPDLFDETFTEQVQRIVDHEAFTEPIRIMPDGHPGSGAVIGFTMELGERVVPNTVGVDIGCFAGRTRVKTLSGVNHRIDELAASNEDFEVWSCKEDGEITASEATAFKTKEDAQLVEILLDSGHPIECTPDHEFMLLDGSYTEARDLSVGDRLMPFYFSFQSRDGYMNVQHNDPDLGTEPAHKIVARSRLMGDEPEYDDQRTVVHHVDSNKYDNRSANLEYLGHVDHSILHGGAGDHWQSDPFEKTRLDAIRAYAETEAGYEQLARTGTENITKWMEENPEAFEQSVEGNGERGKEYLEDFNTTERRCEICGEVCDNPASEYWHQIREHPEETDYEIVERAKKNHRVQRVRKLDETEDVYCLNVPEYHNFALASGVFVHNCGVSSASLETEKISLSYEEADERIRSAVPFGRSTHDFESAMHVGNEFPWDTVTERFHRFNDSYAERFDREIDVTHHTPNGEYDIDYFKALCERVGYDINRAIASVGTLGGGNHFVEIARSEREGDLRLVLHSGSRGLGLTVANYWQDRAVENRRAGRARDAIATLLSEGYGPYLKFDPNDVTDEDLLLWLQGGMGESFMRKEAIRADFEGDEIDDVFTRLKGAIPTRGGDADEDELAYLEGSEAHGYFVDMLFCQQYASTNRRRMIELACDALGLDGPTDVLDSPHNVIDFDDGVIRKGATRVHEGEVAVIPFTMADGSILIEGKGNPEWNRSSPHGAGRLMSRTQAFDELSMDDYEASMDGIYSTSVTEDTLDESPESYKNPEAIEAAMADTATVVDRLVPEHSLKAED